jgi:hypothetical protein
LTQTTREARVLFKAGRNRDGYFDADNLLSQVDKAIDIFEGLTKGYAQGLFLFDNAPSHQKRASDAISARSMVKGVSTFSISYQHRCRVRHLPVFMHVHVPSAEQCQVLTVEFSLTDSSHRAEGRLDTPP